MKYGAKALIIVVPHTFGGDLKFNTHLHVLISKGGLQESSGQWIPNLHLNKNAVMKMWRYAVIEHLRRALKAGIRYTVTRTSEKILWIFNSQNQGTIALSNRIEGKARDSSKLVFHHYGNTYFLSEVWVAGSRIGRGVLRSRSEKESAGKRAEMEIAELQIAR